MPPPPPNFRGCVTRHALAIFVLGLCALSASAREQPPAVESLLKGDDAIVVRGERDGPIVTAGKRFGGSIVSVYYRGIEYVNNDAGGRVDYGRQLQSAVQYRDVAECFNPTEAGGKYDHDKNASSSRLLSFSKPDGRTLMTETDMAFWMAPGQKKDTEHVECTAVNQTVRAGYRLKRTLRVGVGGFPGAIQYDTQYFTPVPENKARYEAVVIHTPKNFTRFFRLQRRAPPAEVTAQNERASWPFMQATADLRHAVVVCNVAPQGEYFYGLRRFGNTSTTRFVEYSTATGTESRLFRNYVIVGTFDEVQSASDALCLGVN